MKCVAKKFEFATYSYLFSLFPNSLYKKSDAAARLNETNYYSMCKLLLQMEDETDSKRSLRHDQYKQKVKHEFGKRYSLQIVNIISCQKKKRPKNKNEIKFLE